MLSIHTRYYLNMAEAVEDDSRFDELREMRERVDRLCSMSIIAESRISPGQIYR